MEIEKQMDVIAFNRKPVMEFCSEFEKQAERAILTKMNKDIPVSQKHSLLKELEQLQRELIQNAQEALYKMLNDQMHQQFDPVYKIIRELQDSFKRLEIEEIDFNKVKELTDLDEMLSSMEMEDLSDIFNAGNYTYQKSHRETRTRVNPEREGFFGIFKFWKPKTITETITVSDGEYISAELLYSEVVKMIQDDFEKRIQELENSYVVLLKDKRKACMTFLKKVSEEQEKELGYLRALAKQVENSKLNIKENERCILWMENCNAALSKIV